MPLAAVHKGAVLYRLLFVEKTHGRTAPYLADSATGVSGEHVVGAVESAHGAGVTSFGVNRFFTVGSEGCCRGHSECQGSCFSVIDKVGLG